MGLECVTIMEKYGLGITLGRPKGKQSIWSESSCRTWKYGFKALSSAFAHFGHFEESTLRSSAWMGQKSHAALNSELVVAVSIEVTATTSKSRSRLGSVLRSGKRDYM